MARPKLRVLIDLSMARRGYCGIAQDVRLLYKTLSDCPEVDVTGLIYAPHKLARPHRFVSRRASRSDRLANQARFLWKLGEPTQDWPGLNPLKLVRNFGTLRSTFFTRRAACDMLDNTQLRDIVWRQLFGQTLSAADRPLVQQGKFLLSNASDGMLFARTLSGRSPLALDTRGYDFLIVQGPRPFRVSPGTQQIVRYHDMIPVLEPDTMSNPWVIKWHHQAIRHCRQNLFVCNSEPTRETLVKVHADLEPRSVTIPYVLSDVYQPARDSSRTRSILSTRRSSRWPTVHNVRRLPRYLMSVSTLEPRKNFEGLIQAFNEVRHRPSVRERIGDLKLVIVGSPGWRFESILGAMRGLVSQGTLLHLEGVSAEELRALYSHAEAFVFPSHAEGFGFPPLEAMQCDTPVIASDLAAHRWVLGDAALYFNPLDTGAMADTIERLIASDESAGMQAELIARGRRQTARYSVDGCRAQWLELLERSRAGELPASWRKGPEPASVEPLIRRVA